MKTEMSTFLLTEIIITISILLVQRTILDSDTLGYEAIVVLQIDSSYELLKIIELEVIEFLSNLIEIIINDDLMMNSMKEEVLWISEIEDTMNEISMNEKWNENDISLEKTENTMNEIFMNEKDIESEKCIGKIEKNMNEHGEMIYQLEILVTKRILLFLVNEPILTMVIE